jgi:hypothetical protein
MYDEVFQAMAVEAGAMLLKPFLGPSFDGVISWKSPVLKMFFQFAKPVKVQGGQYGCCMVGGEHVSTARYPAGCWWCEQYMA